MRISFFSFFFYSQGAGNSDGEETKELCGRPLKRLIFCHTYALASASAEGGSVRQAPGKRGCWGCCSTPGNFFCYVILY